MGSKWFNISFRRVGGINFLKLGRITIMWCVSRERRPMRPVPVYVPAPTDHSFVTKDGNPYSGEIRWCRRRWAIERDDC